MKNKLFVLATLFTSIALGQSAIINDGVTAYNTLIDEQTGGAEFFTAGDNATVFSTGLEFNDYLGLFDVDFTETQVIMGLIGNAALDGVPLLFPGDPNPRFDTYYYFFDNHNVTDVSVNPLSGDLAEFSSAGIVLAGDLNFANESFTTNTDGFFVRIGPGADYTDTLPDNLFATVSLSFSTEQIPEPGSALLLAISGLFLISRRSRLLPR